LDEEKKMAYIIAGRQVNFVNYSDARNPVLAGAGNLPDFGVVNGETYEILNSKYLVRLQGGCGKVFDVDFLGEPVAELGGNCGDSSPGSVADGRVFMMNPSKSEMEVWSLEDPAAPVQISTFKSDPEFWKIHAIDRNRVVVAGNKKINVLLLRDP
jgi:hypothetical protein